MSQKPGGAGSLAPQRSRLPGKATERPREIVNRLQGRGPPKPSVMASERPARRVETPAAKAADRTPAAKPAEAAPKPDEERAKRRKPRSDKGERAEKAGGRKAGRNGERSTKKSDDESSMASPEVRERRVDMQSISPEDAEAWAKLKADLRHMRGRHGGKMGGLGWEETTDAGRSALIARSGNGAYKILHAGADTYGLFYDWDNGTYERLACGRAEDLMNHANEQARSGSPLPPPTKLSLELARLVCGNTQQKASAAERLEPVFREVDLRSRKLRRPRSQATRGSRSRLSWRSSC